MQTLSSASRTCMASASAVECTATVGMPSSLHARKTRSAISPRFAMRILSNIGPLEARSERQIASGAKKKLGCARAARHSLLAVRRLFFDDHQRLVEFDGL